MAYDLNGLAEKLALKQNPPKPINTINSPAPPPFKKLIIVVLAPYLKAYYRTLAKKARDERHVHETKKLRN